MSGSRRFTTEGLRVFLDPLMATLLVLAVTLLFIVTIFLPSIVELKKPKDRGPRRIQKLPFQRPMTRSPRLISPPRSNLSGATFRIEDLQRILADAGIRSCRIDERTVRVLEGVEFEPGLEILDDIIIEGALKIGAKCVFHSTVKAKGNVFVAQSVVIDGSLISLGDIYTENKVVIGGLIHSEGRVTLGENVIVGLDLVASGDVELYSRSEVNGNIITPAAVKTVEHPEVELPKTIDDID